jgi:hypothetical protein
MQQHWIKTIKLVTTLYIVIFKSACCHSASAKDCKYKNSQIVSTDQGLHGRMQESWNENRYCLPKNRDRWRPLFERASESLTCNPVLLSRLLHETIHRAVFC